MDFVAAVVELGDVKTGSGYIPALHPGAGCLVKNVQPVGRVTACLPGQFGRKLREYRWQRGDGWRRRKLSNIQGTSVGGGNARAIAGRNAPGVAWLAEVHHAFGNLHAAAVAGGLHGKHRTPDGGDSGGRLDFKAGPAFNDRANPGVNLTSLQAKPGVDHAGFAILGQPIEHEAGVGGDPKFRAVGQFNGCRSRTGENFVSNPDNRIFGQREFSPIHAGDLLHVAGDRNHPGRFGLTFQPVYGNAQGIPGAEFGVAGQAIMLQQSLLCGLLGKQRLGYARNRITLA